MLLVMIQDYVVTVQCLKLLTQVWSDFTEGPNRQYGVYGVLREAKIDQMREFNIENILISFEIIEIYLFVDASNGNQWEIFRNLHRATR